MKIYVHTKTSMWMCTVALFIISKIWKQPKYPATGGWITTWYYMRATEHHSTTNRNEQHMQQHRSIPSALGKRSQTQNAPYWYWMNVKKAKLWGQRTDQGCQGLEGSEAEGHGIFLMMERVCILIVVVVTQQCLSKLLTLHKKGKFCCI